MKLTLHPIDRNLDYEPSCCRCAEPFVAGDRFAIAPMPDRGDGITRDEMVCEACASVSVARAHTPTPEAAS